MEVTLLEVYELVQTVQTVVESTQSSNNDMVTMLEMSSNGQADTDSELLLTEIKNSLRYNDDYTALEELSSRLELIDTRLDLEFTVLNDCLGVIASILLAWFSIRFLSWVFRPFVV